MEIKPKYLKGSTVVIEYVIQITNNGDVDEYVNDVVDYKPKDLKFNSNLNTDWYQSGDEIHYTSLKNEKIRPGETKKIPLILTKTMTESNTGLTNNQAQILSVSSSINTTNASINDKKSANVIISASTGAFLNYMLIIVILVVIFFIGIFLINKKL